MNEIDYTRQDTLDVALFMAESPLTQGVDGIGPILAALDAHAGELKPDTIAGRRVVPYSHAAVKRALSEQMRRGKRIVSLVRSADPEVSYEMSFTDGASVDFWVQIVIPFAYVADPQWSLARSRHLVTLVRALAAVARPVYGFGHSKGDLYLGTDPTIADPFAPKKVYEVYWLNVYSAEIVDRLGRARVLSTPAAHLEELPGGGILLLTRPTPVDYASDEARAAQARALAHLRDDVTFDEALARLRARSQTLAHVARDWDPDIADLLPLLLDHVAYARRQEETARLNRYRPPEVSEWRPLVDLLPADVDGPEETVTLYRDFYAERLAALLRREVPGVMEGDPASLPRIDCHFWQHDYPGTFRREDIDNDLVPAIGAYLGEVMVNHLGGRWVPRRFLDESQVVIGDRAWLPFLRARHYMQSRQSILDCSLTQFYRFAARVGRR